MERRAVWRSPPDDPRTIVGFVYADRYRFLKNPTDSLGCLSVIGAFWLLFHGYSWWAGVLGLASLLPSHIKGPRRRVDRLITLPLPATAYPCAVEITRNDSVLGIDHGTVTFIEGWLHFEGFRTSFALSRDDIQRRQEEKLELRQGGEVVFLPEDKLRVSETFEVGLKNRFKADLDRWYRIERSAKGISILPPINLHASGVARAWIELGGSVTSIIVTLAFVLGIGYLSSWIYVFALLFWTQKVFEGVLNFGKVRRIVREEGRALTSAAPPRLEPAGPMDEPARPSP